MIRKRYNSFYLLSTFLMFGCIDSFEPPIVRAENNYLVVEGALIFGDDLTTIKLSRTASLADTSYIQPDLSANVSVVGENGSNQPLFATGNGEYSAFLNLNVGGNYYLSITTEDGKSYRSEMVTPNITPTIDSINWKIVNNNELEIYVNTHDDENKSQYYKWNFVETWEFNAAFNSTLEYLNGQFLTRQQENQIHICWQNNNSTNLLLGTTAPLSQNIIYQKVINYVPFNVKLSKKYSILINQQALSKEVYFYLENMKKNSEELGSFYDAQPTEIKGNIYSVDNPNEPVIGYIYASSNEKKRIFITNEEIGYYHREGACPEDALILLEPGQEEELFVRGSSVPIQFNEFGAVIYTNSYCGNCKVRGTNVMPSFWE